MTAKPYAQSDIVLSSHRIIDLFAFNCMKCVKILTIILLISQLISESTIRKQHKNIQKGSTLRFHVCCVSWACALFISISLTTPTFYYVNIVVTLLSLLSTWPKKNWTRDNQLACIDSVIQIGLARSLSLSLPLRHSVFYYPPCPLFHFESLANRSVKLCIWIQIN